MSTLRSVVTGVGSYLPKRVVPNQEFTDWLDTSHDWIVSRSGIESRHFAAEGELTSDLAINAAKTALADAGYTAQDIDAIILATSTPDQTFPSTATRVQYAIGMTGGFAFDIQAVCAGFAYALANADALILAGQAKRILVIGAETFSRIMNWEDRTTCVLFGDGAGALLLEAQEGTGSPADRGILATDLNSDGAFNDLLYVDGGVSSTQTAGVLVMEGKEIFKHAVQKLTATAETALAKAGFGQNNIDWVVPHQANLRIIRLTAQKLRVPMKKVIVTVQNHGNTSAASIPLALAHGKEQGLIKPGQVLVCEAIGGGLAWGAAVIRW
ncbi:MAG: ketoacyl-ACP synthase III [Rhodobacteraceae bacterium]|nr:ketoacyl-ACP synthase III [Paracoccaceae bacterium]